MQTWRQMEKLVDRGLVRHIGTSNMTIPKLELVLRDARIRPACNEMELHPHFQQPRSLPVRGRERDRPDRLLPDRLPGRPERDRTPEDTVDIEDPVIVPIAERLGVHPAVVCVKWAIQRGQIPIPFSVKRAPLPREPAGRSRPTRCPRRTWRRSRGIDRNCRLIKGQVFLWKDGQTWEDLWDLDGRITQ